MTCYHPLKAWKPLSDVDGGRYVFNAAKALNPDNPVKISCGQCIGCRQDRVSAWAVRCTHEAQVHSDSCFITLTYDDEHVPQDYSVKLHHWQLFMKRLRKRFGSGIRFFACGEYGEQGGRPHYHALLYGFDFPDKVYYSTRNGHRVFKSQALEELWGMGRGEVGSVTIESAGYCAQYVQKKQNGDRAFDHYTRISPMNGETYTVSPEFAVMSRRPGIGDEWFHRFAGDVFPSDHVVIDDQSRRVPDFYVKRLAMLQGEDEAERLKRRRRRLGLRYSFEHSGEVFRSAEKANADRSPARLAVREYIHRDRLSRLVRTL